MAGILIVFYNPENKKKKQDNTHLQQEFGEANLIIMYCLYFILNIPNSIYIDEVLLILPWDCDIFKGISTYIIVQQDICLLFARYKEIK